MPRRDRGAADRRADRFLRESPAFRLGDLPTEGIHPLTADLSRLATSDPAGALRLLHRLDRDALSALRAGASQVADLAARMGRTLRAGHRIHLAGCGSTGRLALACESIWRGNPAGGMDPDRVTSFMAGGDTALVRAAEGFEDSPELGARQLDESGFAEGDLLVACTEGGETPFVIGAVERAAGLSRNPPCFLYCNPDGILSKVAERSARVLADGRIVKMSFPTGPMALSGSTRMQASTVLMAAVGLALANPCSPRGAIRDLRTLQRFWEGLDTAFLAAFAEKEAAAYAGGGRLIYVTDPELAVTVLTDTAERSPTFGFPPFADTRRDPLASSPCHLLLPKAPDGETAWRMILGRPPRGLEWPELGGSASTEALAGYDFGRHGLDHSPHTTHEDGPHVFSLSRIPTGIEFRLDGTCHALELRGLPPLSAHLILKMLLNAHSTLVMGRLGRYDGNVMTWVRPSNNKLIDRALRYADRLLRKRGKEIPYDDLARACFRIQTKPADGRPVVHALVDHFRPIRAPRRKTKERKTPHGNPMDAKAD
jgi:N-acetylmuramic acid 6-phosphate etherase